MKVCTEFAANCLVSKDTTVAKEFSVLPTKKMEVQMCMPGM